MSYEERVTLPFGYRNDDGLHREVVIGRRLTGGDLMRIGDDPDSLRRTQFNLLLLQAVITQFGSLRMPVPLSVLLALNQIDRETLNEAYNRFVRATAEGRSSEQLDTDTIRLAWGFERDGVRYDIVRFGRLLTGYDELEVDELIGWRRACALLGRQIVEVRAQSGARFEGPVPVELFETLDAADVYALEAAASSWLDSFRPTRAALSADTRC
ncbi:MAG: hypothetical protein IRY83_13775 [Chloroflexi bacterium]|nr:hypothetical protein [Chloroflexota bacterium]